MKNAATVSLPPSVRETAQLAPVYSSHLDLLRGLAASVVVLGHVRFLLEDLGRMSQGTSSWEAEWAAAAAKPVANLMNPPHEAVMLFFVLSGALVGGSVLRDQNSGRFSWGTYWLKRLSRLLTVLVPALVIGFVLDCMTRHLINGSNPTLIGRLHDLRFSFGFRIFFGNLLFLQIMDRTRLPSFGSNTALWSLSAEFWYYVLFPLLVFALSSKSYIRRVMFLLLASVVASFMWKSPLSRFDIWVLGALVTLVPLVIPERLQRFILVACRREFVTTYATGGV